MNAEDLHVRYAPVMHFSQGERFFPMQVEDFLAYSMVFKKGQRAPLVEVGQVTPEHLAQRRLRGKDVFLRSVAVGPLSGVEVAAEWGEAAVRLLYEYATTPTWRWTEAAARAAYNWFSEKTRPATKRFWWNHLLLPKAEEDERTGLRQELPRFALPGEVRGAAIDAYEVSQGSRPRFTYYYRLVEADGYLNLQYWFFYAYNDWANGYGGFNDHEGDWEGFHLFFRLDGGRPVEPPDYLTYLGHQSRMTKPWDHPEVERIGTHPVIYVAAGSHASYPERRRYPLMAIYDLVDYATGDAYTLDHRDWHGRINLDDQAWLLDFRGSWGTRYWLPLQWMRLMMGSMRALIPGEITLPGVSGPRHPRFDDRGRERKTWQSMLEFAGIV